MRTFLTSILAVILTTALFNTSAVHSSEAPGITTHVPLRISQITDETLRMALELYSPNYDTLSHQAKARAYVNIYKALYNNALPPLTADDITLLSAGTAVAPTYTYGSQPVYRSSSPTHRYEPWWDPMWNPRQESAEVMRNFYKSGLPHSGWHWSLP